MIENGIWVNKVVWNNGTRVEYDDYCASKNRTACQNITTDGNRFYLTVYHNDPNAVSELALINVDEVIPFGKKTFLKYYFIYIQSNTGQFYQYLQHLSNFHFSECHVDKHCKPKLACSVNFTTFDEDKKADGECVDPCLSFASNCNHTQTCAVKNHLPYCDGKYLFFADFFHRDC